MNNKNSWSKNDWIGFFTYIILLIGFLAGLVWLLYFSNELDILHLLVGGYFRESCYMILLALGLIKLADIFYLLCSKIFYPDTDYEKEYKTLFKKYRKREILKVDFKKEKLALKIKNLKNKYKK